MIPTSTRAPIRDQIKPDQLKARYDRSLPVSRTEMKLPMNEPIMPIMMLAKTPESRPAIADASQPTIPPIISTVNMVILPPVLQLLPD
jgi:hypothetical protein